MFRRPYSISSSKESTIGQLEKWDDNNRWRWNLRWRKNRFTWEVMQEQKLMSQVMQIV